MGIQFPVLTEVILCVPMRYIEYKESMQYTGHVLKRVGASWQGSAEHLDCLRPCFVIIIFLFFLSLSP